MEDEKKDVMIVGDGNNEEKEINVSGSTGKIKKRRTADEIAKDLERQREEKLRDVEEYEKNSVSYEKQIRELMKKKQAADRKIKSARRDIRNHVGMKTFGEIVKVLDFKSKEQGCNTLSEFEDLRKSIRNRIEDLLEIEKKYKAEHPEM